MRIIPNTNNNYSATTDGRIYSNRRNSFLSLKLNWDGYLRIQIWQNGEVKYVGVHRLIAQTFLDNPENKEKVNHKNGIKSDNRIGNLEWVSQSENINHGLFELLPYNQRKPKKYKVSQWTLDGQYVRDFDTQAEAALHIGCHKSGISPCCLGKKQSHGGFVWRYKGDPFDLSKIHIE